MSGCEFRQRFCSVCKAFKHKSQFQKCRTTKHGGEKKKKRLHLHKWQNTAITNKQMSFKVCKNKGRQFSKVGNRHGPGKQQDGGHRTTCRPCGRCSGDQLTNESNKIVPRSCPHPPRHHANTYLPQMGRPLQKILQYQSWATVMSLGAQFMPRREKNKPRGRKEIKRGRVK